MYCKDTKEKTQKDHTCYTKPKKDIKGITNNKEKYITVLFDYKYLDRLQIWGSNQILMASLFGHFFLNSNWSESKMRSQY